VVDGIADSRQTMCDVDRRGLRCADMAARVPAAPGCAMIAEVSCDAGPSGLVVGGSVLAQEDCMARSLGGAADPGMVNAHTCAARCGTHRQILSRAACSPRWLTGYFHIASFSAQADQGDQGLPSDRAPQGRQR
jgi:hypothetical protein